MFLCSPSPLLSRCHPCTPSKYTPNTTTSPSIAFLGASWQGLMIPAHRRHHRRSSRRRRREKIAGESRERTMPATTNTTVAIAGARSRGNASGCRQTATHAEMTTWRRGQAKAGRVRCCCPPLGLCARKKRRG